MSPYLTEAASRARVKRWIESGSWLMANVNVLPLRVQLALAGVLADEACAMPHAVELLIVKERNKISQKGLENAS